MLAASTGLGLISSVRILYEVESPASSSGFAFKTLTSPGISGLGSRQSIRSHNEPYDSRSRDFQGSPWYMLRCAGIVTTSVTWLSQVGSPSCLYPNRQGHSSPYHMAEGSRLGAAEAEQTQDATPFVGRTAPGNCSSRAGDGSEVSRTFVLPDW